MLALAMLFATGCSSGTITHDGEGRYTIFAAGTVLCADWNAARRNAGVPALQLTWWIGGYITAYNRFVPATRNVAAG